MSKKTRAEMIREILDIYENSTAEEKAVIWAYVEAIVNGKTREEALEQANIVRVSFGKKPVPFSPGLVC